MKKTIEEIFDNKNYNIEIRHSADIIEIEIESDIDIKVTLEHMKEISDRFDSKNVYVSSFSTYDNYDGSGYHINTDYSITINVDMKTMGGGRLNEKFT